MSDRPRESKRSFGWGHALVLFFVVAALVYLAIPERGCIDRGTLSQTLNNAKQIHLATYRMAQDFALTDDPKLAWPGDLAISTREPVTSLDSFVERLIALNYFSRSDIRTIFTAPGVEPYAGVGPFTIKNSAFKIYLVKEADLPEVLFLATKNFTFGQGLNSKAKPYGDTGFVFVRKGGDAIRYSTPNPALNRKCVGLMPGHTEQDDPGEETSKNVWKD